MPRHSPCALSSLNLHELRKSRWRFFFSVCSFFTTFDYGITFILLSCLSLTQILLHTCFSICFYSICFIQFSKYNWWAQVGSNHRPRAYQARALACWAMSPKRCSYLFPTLVEMKRFELLTPCLQGRCSPSWATPPEGYFLRTLKIEQRMTLYKFNSTFFATCCE